ncbi:MAG: hypothetical protein K2X11_18930 [Acetobacteraceae bacterium]|nr:hypothetical protein [Acetobacteraceae bacterium]
MYLAFETLIALHILTGTTAAIAFWVPVVGRKGGERHRKWGKVFTLCMLATGGFAIGMSLLTLLDPFVTHPHLEGRFDAPFLRGIFGWLMLHMGILTVNLAWYGWLAVLNRRDHAANRTTLNMALQPLVIVAALNCAVQGWLIGQHLMIGLAVVGVATGVTNLRFLLRADPPALEWQREHLKALVGAGISVYTAFMAFGSVRIIPELALHPGMWGIPLVTGVAIILYQWRKIARQRGARPRAPAAGAPA